MKKLDPADVLVGAGLVLLTLGLWQIWPPLAMIVLGFALACLGLAAFFVRRRSGVKAGVDDKNNR